MKEKHIKSFDSKHSTCVMYIEIECACPIEISAKRTTFCDEKFTKEMRNLYNRQAMQKRYKRKNSFQFETPQERINLSRTMCSKIQKIV